MEDPLALHGHDAPHDELPGVVEVWPDLVALGLVAHDPAAQALAGHHDGGVGPVLFGERDDVQLQGRDEKDAFLALSRILSLLSTDQTK